MRDVFVAGFVDELEKMGAFERTKGLIKKVALPLALTAGGAAGGAALEKTTGIPSSAYQAVSQEVHKPRRTLGRRSVAELGDPTVWAKDIKSGLKHRGIIKKKSKK